MSIPMTEPQARAWMYRHRHEHDNATSLAEACAADFEEHYEGGPLDDPDHYIWELAIEILPPDYEPGLSAREQRGYEAEQMSAAQRLKR